MPVIAQLQRQAGILRHGAQALQHAPVARGTSGPVRAACSCAMARGQFTGQGAAVLPASSSGDVVQRQALFAQLGGEVAHGTQEQGAALLG